MKEVEEIEGARCYDTTALRHTGYRNRIHRDYLAHVFRWGFASRYVNETSTGARRVLEAGCGADAQLYETFIKPRGPDQKPEFYVGVDLNKIPVNGRRRLGTQAQETFILKEQFNFVERWQELLNEYGATFDLAISFEVIEHMEEAHGDEYLRGIHALLAPTGRLMLSTPVFNGHAAANHIKEYTVQELQTKLEKANFVVDERFGTFGSYPQIKKGLREKYSEQNSTELIEMYDNLRKFYSDDVLACFLSPVLPDHARNNVWMLSKSK